MPKVLFIHNGSSSRFGFLAKALQARGWTGALINGPNGTDLEGLNTVRWRSNERKTDRGLYRRTIERLTGGEGAAVAAAKLKSDGFTPDLIIGHPAWGEMLFLDEVWLHAPQMQIGELYYGTQNTNFDFDPEFRDVSIGARVAHRAGNAALALSHTHAARLIVPTPYQASTFPDAFQSRIRIIHEGIDTKVAKPVKNVRLRLKDGQMIDGKTPLITFINRRFEPMRGFHIFMRALPSILDRLPDAQVLMIGMDDADTYGASPKDGWKARMLAEVGDQIDRARVHWVGFLPYAQLSAALSLSWAHVYLTYPFVLSWSLLDAMAAGAIVIGSDTAPVRDVVKDGLNGLLVDFHDVAALADRIVDACKNQTALAGMRRAARATVVEQYDQDSVCLPAWLSEIGDVAGSHA